MHNFIDNLIFTASIGIIIGVLSLPVQADGIIFCVSMDDPIGPKVAMKGPFCPIGWMPA